MIQTVRQLVLIYYVSVLHISPSLNILGEFAETIAAVVTLHYFGTAEWADFGATNDAVASRAVDAEYVVEELVVKDLVVRRVLRA